MLGVIPALRQKLAQCHGVSLDRTILAFDRVTYGVTQFNDVAWCVTRANNVSDRI